MEVVSMRMSLHHADVFVPIPVFRLHVQSYQVVECLHHIHLCLHEFVILGSFQCHGKRILKHLQIQQRVARLHIEHIFQHIALLDTTTFVKLCRSLLLLNFQVIQRVLVLLQAHVFEALGNALAGDGLTILPVGGVYDFFDA